MNALLRSVVAAFCFPLLVACANQARMSPADLKPQTDLESVQYGTGVPFAGLWLGDAKEGGAVVRGVIAGPAAIAGVEQGDRILRIGARPVDAREAHALFAASSIGDRLLLQIMRGQMPLQLEMVIDARERWSGPAAFPAAVPFSAVQPHEIAQTTDPVIQQALIDAPEHAPINRRLDRMFVELARDDTGFHKLPLLRSALMRPDALSDWRDNLLTLLPSSTKHRGGHINVICGTLALTCPVSEQDLSDEPVAFAEFAARIATANQRVHEIFSKLEGGRARALADLNYLMEKTAVDRTLLRQPGVLRGIRAMQFSMKTDLAALLAVAEGMIANVQRLPEFSGTTREPPAALRSSVRGEILDYVEIDGGYLVIGGSGSNQYEMDRLYAVIDLDGDDTYRWRDGMPLETQTVIDLNGDDRYEAARAGPAAGWLGVSVLIDRAGNDRYESAIGGCGAGALGFGFLFDHAGADIYRCAAWSIGAGLYGGGLLIDSGNESDVYVSDSFSQGIGGPRGFGLLLDAGGADLYRANGPVPSAYGTPGSFMSFSQGVGVGIRPYDTGGVGALFDLGGDDRYEGGEFSQGGGYYWGVGLLHDQAGNDLYYGNRYAQGFAAHQAFGMLSDMAGEDIYWAMTAAGQGAAWDQSIAILFDGAGNDVYRAQSLSQGAAAQQSRAWLHDLSGDDIYNSANAIAQGAAGENEYHFSSDDPIYSLGVLLDESGTDRYSTGLLNGEVRFKPLDFGRKNGGGVAGIAIDRE